jgi:hypothetical protein
MRFRIVRNFCVFYTGEGLDLFASDGVICGTVKRERATLEK